MTETEASVFQSALLKMPKQKRRPSDDLPERGALARRFAPIPALKDLQKHAEKFGSECVVETAVELGYPFEACVRLVDACDRADLALLRKIRSNARLDRRPPSEDRVRLLMGLEKETGGEG